MVKDIEGSEDMQELQALDWIALSWIGLAPYLVIYIVMVLRTDSCLLPLRPFKVYKREKENETGVELLVLFLYGLLVIWTTFCVSLYVMWK
ncbi:hypothetical protein CN495_08705 [Bacillus thuringiensis]|uniref:Uncharacterized protein n=1 Tax=Bacillus thuringiensis TaxID=1428 RepID=A0ABD6S8K1_BACTU|nr:hypothetical protein CN495_08705 [Bacillus thuringiensis]